MIKKTSIKFWPAEYHSQSAIHAALELRRDIPDRSKIVSIDIESFDAAVDIIGKDPEKWRPKRVRRPITAFLIARPWRRLDGDVTVDLLQRHALAHQALFDLVAPTQIHRNADLTARYPRGFRTASPSPCRTERSSRRRTNSPAAMIKIR